MENNSSAIWQGTFEIWQNKDFGKIYSEFGHRGLYYFDDVQIFVSSRPFIKNTTAYLYCAPENEEWLMKVKSLAKSLDVAKIWIYSAHLINSLSDFLEEEVPTFVLDLANNKEMLWKKFGKKTRNMVRKGEKSGIIVKMAKNEAELDEWWRLYSDLAEKKNFGRQNDDLVRELFKNKNLSRLFLSTKNGRIVGGSFFLVDKYPMYWLGAFDRGDKSSAPGHINIWKVMEYFQAKGYDLLDLGGADLEKNDGSTLFKKSFDGEVKRGYIYIIPVNKFKKVFLEFILKVKR